MVVQRTRDQLLAGTGLARDQHRHTGTCETADRAIDLLHCWGLPDHRGHCAGRRLPDAVVAVEAGRLVHELDRLVDIERFGQVLEGPALVSRDGVLEVRVRRDHDDRQLRAGVAQALEQRDAAHAGHAHVGDQDVGRPVSDCLEQVLGPLETAGIHIGLLERLLEDPAHRLVIVDDPDVERSASHRRAPVRWGCVHRRWCARVGCRIRSGRRGG